MTEPGQRSFQHQAFSTQNTKLDAECRKLETRLDVQRLGGFLPSAILRPKTPEKGIRKGQETYETLWLSACAGSIP
jgi:hypothetical protein